MSNIIENIIDNNELSIYIDELSVLIAERNEKSRVLKRKQ